MTVSNTSKRYSRVPSKKSTGATYTPKELSDFVADQLARKFIEVHSETDFDEPIRILDPAVGDGQLLLSLIESLPHRLEKKIVGFDCDAAAVRNAKRRLANKDPRQEIAIRKCDFLEQCFGGDKDRFDLIIANPPYVRTQVMGADYAKSLAQRFGLSGRVDLYHAFLLAMAGALREEGFAGIITSNRFMTTRAGKVVREMFERDLPVHRIWDFGDTKLFDAAVLPAVVLAGGVAQPAVRAPQFSSVYEANGNAAKKNERLNLSARHSIPTANSVIASLAHTGNVQVADGRRLSVQHGKLVATAEANGTWRLATAQGEEWLKSVTRRTWKQFGQIGAIRVGVKTCADKVFIRDAAEWKGMGADRLPELLRPLTTHHAARPYRSLKLAKQVLYPHRTIRGRRLVADLNEYPKTRSYLERHRATLQSRKYVTKAGRKWYELWVPHDPSKWSKPKLIFRDIAAKPCFWIDRSGSVVNGDCYWMTCDSGGEDLLWLAAGIGNSEFIGQYYDLRFNNKLYAGRRRFLTQYVENFPLPNPDRKASREIIELAKKIYAKPNCDASHHHKTRINKLVWSAFGVRPIIGIEEISG